MNNIYRIRFRRLAIVFLALFNLWELVDLALADNAYASLIGFIVVITPLAGTLFFLSVASKDTDDVWLKKIATVGRLIGLTTFILTGLLVVYRLVKHYFF